MREPRPRRGHEPGDKASPPWRTRPTCEGHASTTRSRPACRHRPAGTGPPGRGPCLVAVLATLGAAKAIELRQSADPTEVGCYDQAALDGEIAITVERFDPEQESPAEACARLWREGIAGPPGQTYAPRLVSCIVSEDGLPPAPTPSPDQTPQPGPEPGTRASIPNAVAWVFPVEAPGGCETLGLAALLGPDGRPVPPFEGDTPSPDQTGLVSDTQALDAALMSAAEAAGLTGTCTPGPDVLPVVQDVLARPEFRDWQLQEPGPEVLTPPTTVLAPPTTQIEGETPVAETHRGPCVWSVLDPASRTVRLSAATETIYPD